MENDTPHIRSRNYTRREEFANTLTHGLGILIGLVGGVILINAAMRSPDNWAVGSVAVYLFGMLFSYVTSTCYHGCREGRIKTFLRKFDHSAIYFHIAGTYTPFTLIVLRDAGAWGWSLFSFSWLAAISGTILSFRKLKTHSHLETICFVIMGSVILTAFKPLIDILSSEGRISALYWLIAGGIFYISGALFYSWTKKEYMHTVFHLFVMAGTICHMIAIYDIL